MPDTDLEWSRAFAKQARSDLGAREALAYQGSARCHRLHFLQMAAEKVCKAYLVRSNGYATLKRTHGCVEKTLPLIVSAYYGRSLAERNEKQSGGESEKQARLQDWKMKAVKKLAREIELLAPACDEEETRKDNTEYPWDDAAGVVRVPCEHDFPGIDDSPKNTVFTDLVRVLHAALDDLT